MKRDPGRARSTREIVRSIVGVSTMGRTIVEEMATLASLALFMGMVAIWAQVIAAL